MRYIAITCLSILGLLLSWQLRHRPAPPANGCRFGDCQNGFGHYRWSNGECYQGQWRDGQQSGLGTMFWPDGRSYIGQWEAGKMQGGGALYQANRPTKRGLWQQNQLAQRLKINWSPQQKNNGLRTLQSVIQARPKMAEYSAAGLELQDWFALQLSGQAAGENISWQAQASEDFQIPQGVAAAHRWASPQHAPAIWLAPDLQSEELWASLVFELYNLLNANTFEQIHSDVERGICTEEEYVARFAKAEHKAILQTQNFYKQYWLPACQKHQLPSNPQFWFAQAPQNPEIWLAQYTDKNGYPWQPYAIFYRQLLQNTTKKY